MSNQVLERNALDQLASEYWENGFIVLRGFFSPQVAASWTAECDRLLAQDWVDPNNVRTQFRMNAVETPERIDPVVDVSPCFTELTNDPRITAVVRALLGDEPLLFKDKLIFKGPGVQGYSMHQDWVHGWSELCPADDVLSVSIQIDRADAANGCIELVPGYHREVLTPPGLRTNFRPEELARIDLSQCRKMETVPGDVLIFHSLAPHQSGPNTADYSRRLLYLTYNAARAGDLRTKYYDDYRKIHGGEGFFFK
jgi:hypothetical protein